MGKLLRAQLNCIDSSRLVNNADELMFSDGVWRSAIKSFQRALPPSVDVTGVGCWQLECSAPQGYGTIHINSKDAKIDKRINAHRLMFKLFNPDVNLSLGDRKMQVSHRCHKNMCVNPNHLVLESDKDNKDRDGCRYGSTYRCPHSPKCLFSDE